MSKIYFTLTGTNHYFGKEFLKKGTKIRLEKEPDNEYDKEAIKVIYEGLGKIGYVANSSYTVIGDSMSAGRIYDKIGKKAKAKVVLVTEHGTICSISKKSLLDNQKKVKKYEYKPEEYALHNGKLNKAEKKKAKQCQVEKIQKLTLSLEALLGEKTAEPTLWQKVKSHISGLFSKKTFFELNDFLMVSEQGYPKNQAICVYIWKDKNEQLFWQTGIYNQKLKQFSVCYGTVRYAINEDKVIAWKKMNADAVALEITDRRN